MNKKKLAVLLCSSFCFGLISCEKTPVELVVTPEPCTHNFIKDEADSKNKNPTCTSNGIEVYKCAICGECDYGQIPANGHDFSVFISTTADCYSAGKKTMKCSRCDETIQVDDDKLAHDYQPDPTFVGQEATCVGYGVKKNRCTRCGKEVLIDVDPFGHNFVSDKVTRNDNFPTMTHSKCNRESCVIDLISWDAKDVDNDCKTKCRTITSSNGSTFEEPNYVVNNDGSVSFYGRPIHNAVNLSDDAVHATDYHSPVYDEKVVGSFIEYKIKLDEPLECYTLAAEIDPGLYIRGDNLIFSNLTDDWTPGLKKEEVNGVETTSKYENRYIITIDGVEVRQDLNDYRCNLKNLGRRWYSFPIDSDTYLDLDAGEHTIRITMAGGCLAKFYNIGFQKGLVYHMV